LPNALQSAQRAFSDLSKRRFAKALQNRSKYGRNNRQEKGRDKCHPRERIVADGITGQVRLHPMQITARSVLGPEECEIAEPPSKVRASITFLSVAVAAQVSIASSSGYDELDCGGFFLFKSP
jgi:hypothetical protein